MAATPLLVPTPTIEPISPPASTGYPGPSAADSPLSSAGGEDQLQESLLVLIPVALVVFIIGALLAAYQWQRAEGGSRERRLCQAWRRRISRCRSRRERSTPVALVRQRVTTRGDSTAAMLVEELTDIDADIWDDVHLDEEEFEPDPTAEPLAHSSSTFSSDTTDSEMHVCTVEVHSSPFLVDNDDDNAIPEQPLPPGQGSHVSLICSTDEDVSTQDLELSPPNILTSPSYYSAHSTSAPSSHKTLHSSDTLASTSTSSFSSETQQRELAQEIVDVVHSKEFAEDAAVGILRCGSSQLSLFTALHESRGCPGNSTQQVEVEGSTSASGGLAATGVSDNGPERIVIPLNELQDTCFGASITWDDFDQDMQTTTL